jgi:hypothetical protein
MDGVPRGKFGSGGNKENGLRLIRMPTDEIMSCMRRRILGAKLVGIVSAACRP